MSTGPQRRSKTRRTTGRPAGRAGSASRAGSDAAGDIGSPRDFLTPYVLLAVSTQKMHGYLLEQYLRTLGLAEVQMTTIYRTLRQLEKDGLVRSAWEAGPGGPARRVYTLTEPGRAWLDSGAAALGRYRSAIDAFFGAYRRARTRE